ncbi:hypothetical protein BD749_1922 [Pontibacter ramchanderi]|uniref:Uncharacterized protein n=1 Tax=Pontibacter ramchanderi TaxID=1179743 RepID=A0A2N3UBM9_9BACT|nr:hypothetical protein BD749_1922 [Pontibacter ramchanderi]
MGVYPWRPSAVKIFFCACNHCLAMGIIGVKLKEEAFEAFYKTQIRRG